MYKLRDYQERAVKAGIDFLNSNEKGGAIIVAPTAAGKSLYIANIVKGLDGNTLVLQPGKEILEQNYKKMQAYGETDLGIYSASAGEKTIGKITFATIGSIINKKELFSDFKHLLVDEAHAVNAKGGMYDDFIEFFGGKVLGLTATPFRMHSYSDNFTGRNCAVAKFLHRTRPRIFDKIIDITQIEDLYKQGFLCQIDYEIFLDYDHSAIKLNSTGMDFNEKSLKEYNEKMDIINIVKNNIVNNNLKHFLVFLSSVDESYKLSEKLNLVGITSATVSAETPKKEREDILERFKNGEIKVVTNCGTMTTGFDFPELDCVILGRPTQSVSLFCQMIGRGIRIAPGKEKVKVIDVCGNVNRFGRIETFKIVEEKKGLHRVVSNTGYQTGVDVVSREDLEARGYAGKKESGYSDQIIRFGKYKGTHITRIPNEYIDWCIQNMENEKFKKMFVDEKTRRDSKDILREWGIK